MTTHKIFKIGLIIMVLINAALILFLFQRPQHHPSRAQRQSPLLEKISEKLNLTAKQKSQYIELAEQHRESIRRIEREQRKALKAYFDQLRSPDTSRDSLQGSDKVLDFERQKLNLTYSHFQDLKELLDEKQIAQFDLIIDDIIRVLLVEDKKMPPPPRGQ